MNRRIEIATFGDPSVLTPVDYPIADHSIINHPIVNHSSVDHASINHASIDHLSIQPEPGTVLVRQTAIGVNFVDIYYRTGLYPIALPATLGVEAAGTIIAVGDGVAGFQPGDRVAYAGGPPGSYASHRTLPAQRLIPLPDDVTDETAAGVMLRGMTAFMLLHRVLRVTAGQSLLIHGAAGGLGLILVQWAKHLGVTTIGTVGSPAKADLAQAHGLDHAILYRETDFPTAVARITEGRLVDAAIDGIGGTVLGQTLSAVRPFGIVASVGQAGGPIPPFNIADLGPRRSLTLARPSVLRFIADDAAYRDAAAAVLAMLGNGLRVTIGATYPLADAHRAHRALEAGQTVGSVLLVP